MRLIDRIHQRHVHGRRVRILSDMLAQALPRGARVLDIGSGDGIIASEIQRKRLDVSVEGIDVHRREDSRIPIRVFDGVHIPFANNEYDTALLVDVLHHTNDPTILLSEAARVAGACVIVKDHCLDGLLAGMTLRFMDWVGNARHGVALPYNYWPRRRWEGTLGELGLDIRQWTDRLYLYPRPASWLFDRQLHFIAVLSCASIKTDDLPRM